jgi:hypothetical protein
MPLMTPTWKVIANTRWCAECGEDVDGGYCHCERDRKSEARWNHNRRVDIIARGRAHPLRKSYVKLRRAMFVFHGI